MTLADELNKGWHRESGEVVSARVYADGTMMVLVYPNEATTTPDTGHCYTLDTWREAAFTLTDEPKNSFSIEESEYETVTVTPDDELVRFESTLEPDTLRITREELSDALDHANDARDALEWEGLV